MTIQEWAKQERESIDSFIKFWEDGMKNEKDHFPDNLPIGEWDEQYRLFES